MKPYKLMLALAVLSAPVALAQVPALKEDKPGQLARARVTAEAARATALKRVPGATIVKQEIEEEDGKLVYSFELKVEKKVGIEEVLVDAITGAVVSVEHEDD